MAECSEHFLNSLAAIAAVNAQLLQPNLVIMRRPLDTLPRRFTTRVLQNVIAHAGLVHLEGLDLGP